MRWFAHRFETFNAFQAEHPDIKTWSKTKELLSQLAAKGKKTTSSSSAVSNGAVIHGALKAITSATAKLNTDDLELTKDQKDALLKAVTEFNQAAEKLLGSMGPLDPSSGNNVQVA
jgi:hypothetical protein